MTTGAEKRVGTVEVLSPAELGKRTHAIITDIATRLKGVPEFGDALHRAFFRRNSPGSGRNLPYVYFGREGEAFGWNIGYDAEPIRIADEKILAYQPRLRLSIDKFDKASGNKVSSVSLITQFTERSDGKILKFTYGHARAQNPIHNLYEGLAALEKMPEILGNLFAPIKL